MIGFKTNAGGFRCGGCVDFTSYMRETEARDADQVCEYCAGPVFEADDVKAAALVEEGDYIEGTPGTQDWTRVHRASWRAWFDRDGVETGRDIHLYVGAFRYLTFAPDAPVTVHPDPAGLDAEHAASERVMRDRLNASSRRAVTEEAAKLTVAMPGVLADFVEESELMTGSYDDDADHKAARLAVKHGKTRRYGKGYTLTVRLSPAALSVLESYADTLTTDVYSKRERTAGAKFLGRTKAARKAKA